MFEGLVSDQPFPSTIDSKILFKEFSNKCRRKTLKCSILYFSLLKLFNVSFLVGRVRALLLRDKGGTTTIVVCAVLEKSGVRVP